MKMNFEVSKEAAKWYKEEMDLKNGDFVQFYVQIYGGIPTNNPNYSLGLSVGKEGNIAIKDEKEGITFYFNDEHSWILKENDMKVSLEKGEVEFIFHKKES